MGKFNVDATTAIAVGGVLSTFILGFLGYRRSKAADTVTATETSIKQVIDGLNGLIQNLQEDNKILREHVKDVQVSLTEVIKERNQLRKEIGALRQQYGTTNK